MQPASWDVIGVAEPPIPPTRETGVTDAEVRGLPNAVLADRVISLYRSPRNALDGQASKCEDEDQVIPVNGMVGRPNYTVRIFAIPLEPRQ
jgi:hypothetical protein